MRALRLLVFGETWSLPLGVATILVAGALLRHAAPHAWHAAGGFLLLGGVTAVVCASIRLSAS
jgi:hypothetical protein